MKIKINRSINSLAAKLNATQISQNVNISSYTCIIHVGINVIVPKRQFYYDETEWTLSTETHTK